MNPSRDTFHTTRPELNKGLSDPVSSVQGKPRRTKLVARAMSAQVQRLASRLGKDPDELVRKIPPDTLRRTKFPVIETVNEDGSRSFRHDPGIEEGVRGEIRP